MKSKAILIAEKIISVGACMLMTVFAGVFALMSISALVISIVERDFMSVIGCVAAGFLAWVIWSVRRDLL